MLNRVQHDMFSFFRLFTNSSYMVIRRRGSMDENKLLQRITVNPKIFAGKPIIRGRRLAVEHILGMLAGGDTPKMILKGYPWLEMEDIQACLGYARRMA